MLERLSVGLRTGLVAASATIGVLLGFGLRLGMPARPFNSAAAPLIGSRAADIWGFDPVATPLGLLLHAFLVVFVGLLFAAFALPLRGLRLVLAALLVAGAAFAAVVVLNAPMLAIHESAVLTRAHLALLHLVLAAALLFGIRIARQDARGEHSPRRPVGGRDEQWERSEAKWS